jgi:deoxycytidylate deaminase
MFRIASKQANKATGVKHRLGAVIVKGGRVLSTGYNEIRFSRYLRYTTVHAEESAIIKLLSKNAMGSLSGSDLYVSRTTPAGNSGLARPCDRCMELIKAVGIRRIHYTTDNGETETCYV